MKGVFKSIFKKKKKDGSGGKDDKPAASNGRAGDPAPPGGASSASSKPSSSGSTKRSKGEKKKKKKKSAAQVQRLLPDLPPATIDDLQTLPASFQSVPEPERPQLFVRKLRLCHVQFQWYPIDETGETPAPAEPPKVMRAKEVKRTILLDIVDHMSRTRGFINEAIFLDILDMISVNLFRPLPHADRLDDEEDEPLYDPSWSHLQIVYEFFLRFIVSNDLESKVLKKHINSSFVLSMLQLFNSHDPRERDYLKTILHRIYAKFMSLRAFIRKAINNTFFVFIYDTERHNGVAELLEILGSIINGFALPLKQEHKTFLRRVLLQLHQVRSMAPFAQQLTYCTVQFVTKDPDLAPVVLRQLCKLWPVSNSAKEVIFLNELEEILEHVTPEAFQRLIPMLFRVIRRSIGSAHFQVAERALFLWHNDTISGLIAENRAQILPILYPVLKRGSDFHWNPQVNTLTTNVIKMFMELDQELVEHCDQLYQEQLAKEEQEQQQRQEAWSQLEASHAVALSSGSS